MTTEDQQMKTAQLFAQYIEQTNPEAAGIALMFFECGCIQGGPFDGNGDQVGAITHLGQTIGGEIRVCDECVDDGGAPERVTRPAIVFFEPSNLTEERKGEISRKIFSAAIESER